MILALRMSWGTLPFLRHRHRSSWSGSSAGLPHLITSGGCRPDQGLFPSPGCRWLCWVPPEWAQSQALQEQAGPPCSRVPLGCRSFLWSRYRGNARATDSSVCPCLWWLLQSWTCAAPTSSLAFLLPVWCPHTWAWCYRTRRPSGCCLTAEATSRWRSGVRFVGPDCRRLSALGGSADWGCPCTWHHA